MSESYLGGSRGLAALGSSMLDDDLDSSTYWGEPSHPPRAVGTSVGTGKCWGSCPGWLTELSLVEVMVGDFSAELCVLGAGGELSSRRRRGTGDTESSKINGVLESKTYDTYTSSSGYSSEDDYAGRDAPVPVVAGMQGRHPQGLAVPSVLPVPARCHPQCKAFALGKGMLSALVTCFFLSRSLLLRPEQLWVGSENCSLPGGLLPLAGVHRPR